MSKRKPKPKSELKPEWVVFRLLTKGHFVESGDPVSLAAPEAGIVGVLPVYATYEQAKKEWPDDEPMRIEPVRAKAPHA